MNRVLALILAGGMGNRLSILAEERAKPAVVFAGKYRIIDFVLSNCVNSGIHQIGVLTQYRPRSLNEHIGLGRPWELDRERGGVSLLQPSMGRHASDWYRGTADAVYQNLSFVEESHSREVLVLAGDHVYQMNYESLIAYHRRKKAHVTIGVVPVAKEEASRFGIVALDDAARVIEFQEKPQEPKSLLGSMGIYVFNKDALVKVLEENAGRSDAGHDFGKDIMPNMLGPWRVFGFRFQGYWRDIGTIDSYYQASMELLEDPCPINFEAPALRVRTRSHELPPVKVGADAKVVKSLLSNGCIVHGEVSHSILSPGVKVEKGAVVRDSIIFDNTVVHHGAVVDHSIIDKEVLIGRYAVVGFGADMTPNREENATLRSGITLVGKRARVPVRVKIGRNVCIDPAVHEEDFPSPVLGSGSVVHHREEHHREHELSEVLPGGR
jgi:glucose-1-phosphate adenylyltransferase